MKKFFSLAFCSVMLISISLFTACKSKVQVLEDGLRFCEAVYVYDDVMYISNFGSDVLSPIQDSVSGGYILQYDGEKMDTLIGPDCGLYAPKGMARAGNFLYVADVNRIHAINLTADNKKPITIPLASKDVFVNHLLVINDVLLISVTNSNHILALVLNEDGSPAISGVQIYFSVPGPNGLAFSDGKLFIASYNPSGTSSQENVIYVVEDFNNPVPKPFISRSGQYDGLAIKNGWLYFSDWNNGTIGKINLGKPDQIITLNTDFTMQGPAQISFFDDYLCIPDLVGSKIFMLLD